MPARRANVLRQTKWAPPVMDGMVRTIARGERRGEAENGYFDGHFSKRP
jgi:hypothetical protein